MDEGAWFRSAFIYNIGGINPDMAVANSHSATVIDNNLRKGGTRFHQRNRIQEGFDLSVLRALCGRLACFFYGVGVGSAAGSAAGSVAGSASAVRALVFFFGCSGGGGA